MIMTYPLFIVTGISGSGKSATSLELQKIMVDFNVFDMDLIVNNDDYQTACDNWLKVAYYSAYSGRNSVLFGNVPDPYNIEICDHFPLFNPVHYLHLYCNGEARSQRLSARGKWTADSINYMNELSEKLVQEAKTSVPPIPTLDTSTTSPPQVAKLIKQWIMEKLA
jgi:broad-specificity NMP kinase